MSATRQELTEIRNMVEKCKNGRSTPEEDEQTWRVFGVTDPLVLRGLYIGLNFALSNCEFPEERKSPWNSTSIVPPSNVRLILESEEEGHPRIWGIRLSNKDNSLEAYWKMLCKAHCIIRWMEVPS